MVASRGRGRRRPAVRKPEPRSTRGTKPSSGTELRQIPINTIVCPRSRARRSLGDIASLAESIQEYGLLHPISVRAEDGHYILTAGERRLEAMRQLGLMTVPAFIREFDADQAHVVELIENLQRENLSAEEEADALTELVRTRGWTLEQVAAALKRSVAFVSKRVRVFEDPVLRDAIVRGKLNVSIAEELLAAELEDRARLVASAIEQRWDQSAVREALKRNHAGSPTLRSAERPTPKLVLPAHASFRTEKSSSRPAAFTESIREFHHLIMDVQPHDLTDADRGALRTLFRDLVLLARAPTQPRPRVIPALPTVKQRARRRA